MLQHFTGSHCSPQHWIRLELFPDVLVHRLKMVVDPADSSYMPSMVVVSGAKKYSIILHNDDDDDKGNNINNCQL